MCEEKTIEDNFTDWHGHVFGFGYGTGETYTIPALRKFLELCNRHNHQYDFEVLESELTPTVAWLLINILGREDIIEYGTSPRFAWLNKKGIKLKEFVLSKTNDELYQIVMRDEDYDNCYPDYCNCEPERKKCSNPFWNQRDTQ